MGFTMCSAAFFLRALRIARAVSGVGMNDKAQPSCWGLTVKVMIGVAAVMLLAYLGAAPEASSVLAGR